MSFGELPCWYGVYIRRSAFLKRIKVLFLFCSLILLLILPVVSKICFFEVNDEFSYTLIVLFHI